jgi:L-2-hydroxyglutarate oxidase LhgO
VIQLVGIESPGLTAAGAIGEVVAGLVAEVIGD